MSKDRIITEALEQGMTYKYLQDKGILKVFVTCRGVAHDIIGVYVNLRSKGRFTITKEESVERLLSFVDRGRVKDELFLEVLDLMDEWFTCLDPDRGFEILQELLELQQKRGL